MHSCHQVMLGTLCRLPGLTGRKVGMTSSHHGPYTQGDTRTTMAHTKGSDTARWSKSQKMCLSPDRSLQLDSLKLESLVILDQHARVNAFPGLVHTARHTTKVGFTRRALYTPPVTPRKSVLPEAGELTSNRSSRLR